MITLLRRLALSSVALTAAATFAWAQPTGGRAGTVLRSAQSTRDVSLGGLSPAFDADASSIIPLSAALAWLERPSATASWSSPLFGVIGSASLAVALPVAGAGGIGVALITRSTGEQKAYDAARRPSGTITDRELSLSIGGALAIGPGSAGATVHLLRRDVSGAGLSNSGYAIDLSGTLQFDDQLYFGFALRDIAGEMISGETTLREAIPWQAQLTGAYVHALQQDLTLVRPDQTGIPLAESRRPSAYLLALAGVRYADGDDAPSLSFAGEAVPLASVPVGFRIGINSIGELAGGFFYRLALESVNELRLDYGVRWFDNPSDVTHHVSVCATF